MNNNAGQIWKSTAATFLLACSSHAYGTTNLVFNFDNTGSNINFTDTFIEETVVIASGAEAGTYVLRATHSLATTANPVAVFDLTDSTVRNSGSALPVGNDLVIFWSGGGAPAGGAEFWTLGLTRDGMEAAFDFGSVDVHLFRPAPATFNVTNNRGETLVDFTTSTAAGGAVETIIPTNSASASDVTSVNIASSMPGNGDTIMHDFDAFTLTVTAVPEPSSAFLVLGGLPLLFVRRRQHS